MNVIINRSSLMVWPRNIRF